MLQALQLAQTSTSSLATFGEDSKWDAPFIGKSKDDFEPSSSTQHQKRRKVLGTATVKAACGSNRVKFRCAIWEVVGKTIDLLAHPLLQNSRA